MHVILNIKEVLLRYISTRGQAPTLSFDEVSLTGLACDGGLYIPEYWPIFDVEKLTDLSKLSYTELAVQIMLPFVSPVLNKAELTQIVTMSYRSFNHPAIAPLKQLGHNEWLCELFHGPTLAFKDYALQFLGHLFSCLLRKFNRQVVMIGATSGDTGSAAISAFCNNTETDIFILHPHKKISEIQRRQMTTVLSNNVHNIAVTGTFDDCQSLVKALLSDVQFCTDVNLSVVNSINWARIMVQVVYYFWSVLAVCGYNKSVTFAVPTGNFGNIFAGYVARSMGLPIKYLIIGSNQNDILVRFLATGIMKKSPVTFTISPSMDIQVSSNFERLLFEIYNRDSTIIVRLMEQFYTTGIFSISKNLLEEIRKIFFGFSFSDLETREILKQIYTDTGEIVDPHTAIGIGAARAASRMTDNVPVIVLGTAHPAKFHSVVQEVISKEFTLPPCLSSLFKYSERFTVIPADLKMLKKYIYSHIQGG